MMGLPMVLVSEALDDCLGALVDVSAMLRLIRELEGGSEAPDHSDLIACLEGREVSFHLISWRITGCSSRLLAQQLGIDLLLEELLFCTLRAILRGQIGLNTEPEVWVLLADVLGPGSLEGQDFVGVELPEVALDLEVSW